MIKLTKASEDWMKQLSQQAFDRMVGLLAECEWEPTAPAGFARGLRHIIELGYDKHSVILTYDSETGLIGYELGD